MMDSAAEVLTAEQAADYLGFSADTIRRWAATGRLPVIRLSGRWLRFRKAALDDWLREKEQTTAVHE